MSERAWGVVFPWRRDARPEERRKPSRVASRPRVESLEGRIVMNAQLAAIPNVSVPSSLGYQVNLDGSASLAPSQTYSVTSSNPDLKASVAKGKFWTINVSHTAAVGQPTDISFSGPVTLQLFQDLTPKTAALIEGFITQGYYNGKTIHRIASNFSGTGAAPNNFVIQGGAPNPDGTGNSHLPGTPYGLELNQQLAFVNPYSLAIANTGAVNSNDTQFFWTTGQQASLDFNYTIFGNVVAGFDTIAKLEQVAVQTNAGLGGEKSQPISPVTITSSTLSDVNSNGVIHIDATGAIPGETSTIKVTATDPSTNTTALQTFQVSAIADTTKHPATLTFSPLVYPRTQAVGTSTATKVILKATNNNPNNSAVMTSFSIVAQPSHGKISLLDASAGTLTYTPNAGFTGTDTFTYTATNIGGSPASVPGNTNTVTLNVSVVPVDTGTVRLIGTVLIVTPKPRTDQGTNTILISETPSVSDPTINNLNVTVNGQLDLVRPLASAISQIIAYGSKAGDTISVDPSVDKSIGVLLDGGHGHGQNVLQAGAGSTRLHGWFGQNTLKGGTGPNQLIGRAGHVKFVPTATSNPIFAGVPNPGYKHFHFYHGRTSVQLTPPGGTFYKFASGHLVAIPTPKANSHTQKTK